MRIGFVSLWANRGQGIITRQIREVIDEAGHETFVLARPTGDKAAMPGHVDERDEWRDERVTYGSRYLMEPSEYTDWARANELDVVMTDQNDQFDAIRAVREMGVTTIGRFVWERYGKAKVEPTKAAFDVVYSVTRAEQERYAGFGIESPYVRYGIHPSIIAGAAPKPSDGPLLFIFHGGAHGKRKPYQATLAAFKKVANPDIRLVLKSQRTVTDRTEDFDHDDDPRVIEVVKDMEFDEYVSFFSSHHVCLTPTRWEGLGVWLFESIGFGQPVITTDIPPVNEIIHHGVNGLLARGVEIGKKKPDLPIYDPDVDHLAEMIAEMAEPGRLQELQSSLLADRDRLSWDHTRHDYPALVEGRL
jgi:glycosyltransferase involved in cell wall biosynthesis